MLSNRDVENRRDESERAMLALVIVMLVGLIALVGYSIQEKQFLKISSVLLMVGGAISDCE